MAIRVLGRENLDTDTLRIRVEQLLPVAVVTLDGTLSLSAVGRVRSALLKCLAECPDALVVDLAGLSVDSNLPLAVFRAVRRHASTWPAVPMLLCAPSPALLGRFSRTSLGVVIPVYPTRADALAAVDTRQTVARADRDLLPTLDTPAQARELVRDLCLAWGLSGLVDDARLVVSELVTNALLHARGVLRLSVVLRHRDLHLIVRDQSPVPPRRRPPPSRTSKVALGGRGLYLLDLTAHSWGHLVNDTGKAVWALLRR
jgi:hypothetical protein